MDKFWFGWLLVCAPLFICFGIAMVTAGVSDYRDYCEKKGRR